MNDIEREEREAENDGYRNEHQRALAVSQMNHNSGRGYAQKLVRQGKHVVVEITPAYCKITDGIIGEHVFVRRTDVNRGALENWLASLPEGYFDPEGHIEVWPLVPQSDLYDANADYQAEARADAEAAAAKPESADRDDFDEVPF